MSIGSEIRSEIGPNMTSEDIKSTIVEIIERYCDKPNVTIERLCINKTSVVENLVVKISGNKTNAPTNTTTAVTVETVPDSTTTRRRLLANSGLIDAAVADAEAAGFVSLTATPTGSPPTPATGSPPTPATDSKPTSSATSAAVSVATLAACVFVFVM